MKIGLEAGSDRVGVLEVVEMVDVVIREIQEIVDQFVVVLKGLDIGLFLRFFFRNGFRYYFVLEIFAFQFFLRLIKIYFTNTKLIFVSPS